MCQFLNDILPGSFKSSSLNNATLYLKLGTVHIIFSRGNIYDGKPWFVSRCTFCICNRNLVDAAQSREENRNRFIQLSFCALLHFCVHSSDQPFLRSASCPFWECLVLKTMHNLKGKSERTAMMRFVMVMVGMRD